MDSYEEISDEILSVHEENFRFSEEERVEAQLMCLQIMEDEDFLAK